MMSGYNWVDYILLAIFFICAMSGIVRGGAKEIISILSWVAAYIIAGMFSAPVANYFTNGSQLQQSMASSSSSVMSSAASQVPNFTLFVTFCILFLATLIIGSIIGSLVGRAVDSIGLGIVNRLVGGLVGLAKGYLINVVLIFLVQLTSFGQQPAWGQSSLVSSMQPAVQWFSNLVAPGIESLKSKVQSLTPGVQNSLTNAFQSK